MTTARAFLLAILLTAVAAGIGMYYLQVYAYYEELEPPSAVVLTASGGGHFPLPPVNFRGIDSDSSPIRYRACFEIPSLWDSVERLAPYPEATPLNAPGWFDCFDARAIGTDLESGAARAVLLQANVTYGIDRVGAVYPDGRVYAWHQINACGERVFDGDLPPEGCPPVPERLN